LQEKLSAMLAEEEEQKRLDLMMEIERLRALEAYQVRRSSKPAGTPPCSFNRLRQCCQDMHQGSQYAHANEK
jgi:hypothetical protein